MSKPQRATTAFLNNLKPNLANAKPTDYEVNFSAMKDSGLNTSTTIVQKAWQFSKPFHLNCPSKNSKQTEQSTYPMRFLCSHSLSPMQPPLSPLRSLVGLMC